MLEWILGTRKRELPEYSSLRRTPSRGLPPALAEQERAEPFRHRRDGLQERLRGAPYRPADDKPLFTTLLLPRQRGVLTIVLPDGVARCLPVFSTPFKAADYA